MTQARKVHHADYIVVGSWVAGVRAAIELSQAGSVVVLANPPSTNRLPLMRTAAWRSR